MYHQSQFLVSAPLHDVFSGDRSVAFTRAGLEVQYDCLPPFEDWTTRPNRIGVVFSGHAAVVLKQDGRVYNAKVNPGSLHVIGSEAPLLRRVREYSDILKIYPDMNLLKSMAEELNIRDAELEPTLRRARSLTYTCDPVILGIAHVLRQVCLNQATITDVAAEEIAQLIIARILLTQYSVQPRFGPTVTLSDQRLRVLGEFIEAHLTETISLNALADLTGISRYHFARCFKKTTGLAPHQFVTARRFDLARRRLISTSDTVQDIAISIGYENFSHFRRQFINQFGIAPGALRKALPEYSNIRP